MAQDIIDQLSSLVSEFITRTTAKVRKDFREILITILILHISLPGRINFTQMGRFSNKSERTYRIDSSVSTTGKNEHGIGKEYD